MKAGARPRRGAPPKGEVTARERILATARELFYREGIRAIGVDTVVERSGVSKTSLYRLFESKDALIAAVVAEQDRLFWTWWDRIEEQHADDPRALLEALLSWVAKRIGDPAWRGCPFLNLATEFPDDNHPGRVIARRNKEEVRARLASIVAKLGVRDPDRIASQIALMIDGAYVTGLLAEAADLRGDLVDAAMKFVGLAGRRKGLERDASRQVQTSGASPHRSGPVVRSPRRPASRR
jgi:AcrR family transcriptional regulator